mgnify:FL=1
MKVIKHGDTKSTAREIVTKRAICPNCGCEFEYGSDETWHNEYKQTYVLCPECRGHCMEEEEISLSNPPHFPENFYDFNGGVPQSDQDINDWIREAADYFRTHPEEPLKFIACGNSILIALNMEDGVHFYVAKGYYEADID